MRSRRVVLLAVFCLLADVMQAKATEAAGTEGVPVPKSEPEWHCPVEFGAAVCQGNNGSFSHSDKSNQYAFDYNVKVGTPLVASRSGIVESSKMLSNIGGGDRAFGKEANEITVRHSDGTTAHYVHLVKNRNLVRVGEFVLQGERIGYSGDTGFSTGPHLHFNGGKLSFSDFGKNGGVPDKGDRHGPPAKPAVPQVLIETYKSIYRACLYAEQIDMPEVGLQLIHGLPSGNRFPAYFYAQVLEKKRERYTREIEQRAASSKDDPLVPALVKRVASRIPALKQLADRIVLPEGAIGNTDADKLLNACRLEALGETPLAGGQYASLSASSSPIIKKLGTTGIRRLIANYHGGFQTEMDRLVYESGKCLGKHVSVVKKDLDELAVKLIGLARIWKQHLPEESEKADEALKKAESQYLSATKDLQSRK